MNTTSISVIPTRVRPSALGWSNGVEEPAVASGIQWPHSVSPSSFTRPDGRGRPSPHGHWFLHAHWFYMVVAVPHIVSYE